MLYITCVKCILMPLSENLLLFSSSHGLTIQEQEKKKYDSDNKQYRFFGISIPTFHTPRLLSNLGFPKRTEFSQSNTGS